MPIHGDRWQGLLTFVGIQSFIIQRWSCFQFFAAGLSHYFLWMVVVCVLHWFTCRFCVLVYLSYRPPTTGTTRSPLLWPVVAVVEINIPIYILSKNTERSVFFNSVLVTGNCHIQKEMYFLGFDTLNFAPVFYSRIPMK